MNILCCEFCYIVYLIIGRVLLFIPQDTFWLIPLHCICIIICKIIYKPGLNCSIEWVDIAFACMLTLMDLLFLYTIQDVDYTSIAYLFLCAFTSISFYANTIRYKSLL